MTNPTTLQRQLDAQFHFFVGVIAGSVTKYQDKTLEECEADMKAMIEELAE